MINLSICIFCFWKIWVFSFVYIFLNCFYQKSGIFYFFEFLLKTILNSSLFYILTEKKEQTVVWSYVIELT